MEVNSEEGFAKYSKLVEDNPKANETTMEKQKAEKLVVSWFEGSNTSNSKDMDFRIGFKTLTGLSCIFLMIVVGMVAGLIIMSMEIHSFKRQNQELKNGLEFDKQIVSNLTKALETQKQIAKELKIQNQDILMELKNLQQNHSNAKDEIEK